MEHVFAYAQKNKPLSLKHHSMFQANQRHTLAFEKMYPNTAVSSPG